MGQKSGIMENKRFKVFWDQESAFGKVSVCLISVVYTVMYRTDNWNILIQFMLIVWLYLGTFLKHFFDNSNLGLSHKTKIHNSVFQLYWFWSNFANIQRVVVMWVKIKKEIPISICSKTLRYPSVGHYMFSFEK